MKNPLQFDLRWLLVIVTCLCLVLAMLDWYLWKGLWLAAPHVVMIVTSDWLWRVKRKTSAIAILAAYAALWVATALFGIPAVVTEVTRRQDEFLPEAQRIAHRPLGLESQMDGNRHLRPWKSIGNPTVPCPFVVTIDVAFDAGGLFGGGGREFKFVLPGRTWPFGYNFYWSS